ncbi:MAG: hypothetical protein IKS03_09790 [Ruminococcus sp.]|nr:hypothetical protein [Ruminococcus sp.]
MDFDNTVIKVAIASFITAIVLFVVKKLFASTAMATIISYGMYIFLGLGALCLIIIIWQFIFDN